MKFVPWDTIRAWSEGKADPGADKEALSAKKNGERPGKKAGKRDADTPEKKPAVSVWKPKHPGDRRAVPQRYKAVHFRANQRLKAKLKEEMRYRHFDECWDLCTRLEDHNQALGYLNLMLQNPKQFEEEIETGWVHGRIWQTDMLVEKRMAEKTREHFYRLWEDGTRTAIRQALVGSSSYSVGRLRESAKKLREFYAQDVHGLLEKLGKLDERGDEDPTALWELCERFQGERPRAPLRYAQTLYKLREWFPKYEHVVSGEVQWRIANVLFDELYEYEWSADEADMLRSKCPDNRQVKRGWALWHVARSNHEHGDSLRPRQARPFWEKALKQYRMFQVRYPKNSYNQIRRSSSGRLPSLANEYIRDLIRELGTDR